VPGYHRIVINGSMAAGAETWSTSFGVDQAGSIDTTPEALATWAQACMTYLGGAGAPATALKALLSSAVRIENVQVYYYEDIGQPAFSQGQSTSASFSGSGNPAQAPQVAVVASLLSARPGRSYRGRMYWPAQAATIANSLRWSGASAGMAGNFATMIGVLARSGSDVAAVPVIVSQKLLALTPVTRVSVGDVFDTQRRRRESLGETRYSAQIPA
jgi:hypothetical protein